VNTTAFSRTGVIGADIVVLAIQRTTRDTLTTTANVTVRTSIVVIANNHVVGKHAAYVGVARVVGAQLLIIADHRNSTTTTAVGAEFVGGASIGIIARFVVVKVKATLGEIAKVVGADIVIVTGCRLTTFADSSATGILFGTDAAVIARRTVGCENAARFCGTRIVSARVAIVTGKFARTDALPEVAVVPRSTDIFVVAGRAVEQMDATLNGVTRICGANIVIIAGESLFRHTNATFAVVVNCARIAVGTFASERLMFALTGLDAAICRAGTAIITVQFLTTHTRTVFALIINRTRVSVIAGTIGQRMLTASHRRTTVYGTGIIVTAIEDTARQANSCFAVVAIGAGIAVRALACHAFVGAYARLNTAIGSAGIVVVAIQR
jgi:hypothetical protein